VNELRENELNNYFKKIKPLADVEWEMSESDDTI